MIDDYGTLPNRVIKALQKRKIKAASELKPSDFIGWMEGTKGYVKFDKVAKTFMGKALYDEYDMTPYMAPMFFRKLRIHY